MLVFSTAAHSAFWAGTCPGSHKSAGLVESTKTRHGNPYLKAAHGTDACRCEQPRDRPSPRGTGGSPPAAGPRNAIVPIEHAILIAIWNMAHIGAVYDDLGATTSPAVTPNSARRNAMSQLQLLSSVVCSMFTGRLFECRS
jgi:transposase